MRYLSEIALVGFLDESAAFRTGVDLLESSAVGFTTSCWNYRNRVEDYLSSINPNTKKPALARHLYNPACFVAFGHTDSLALAIVDDIDPIFHITTEVEPAIEQVSVAFLPDVDSLELSQPNRAIICNLHDQFNADGIAPRKRNDGRFAPAVHPFEDETPLIVVTRYKVSGLAVLSGGLHLQRILFRAIARRIHNALDRLKIYHPCPGTPSTIEPDDIETFRCAFLDTQGVAEIGTVMFCRNYSVAIAAIVGIRALTLGDLLDVDPDVDDMLHNDVLKHVFEVAKLNQKGKRSLDSRFLRNHAFASSYTTLCVAREAYEHPETANVNGYVKMHADLDINPGHLKSVERTLTWSFFQNSPSLIDLGPIHKLHRFKVGRHDIEVVPLENPDTKQERFRAVATRDFLSASGCLLKGFGADGENWGETGLMDVSCSMVIPIPRSSAGECLPGHVPLVPTLRKIRELLFSNEGRYSLETLRSALRRRRAPKRLRDIVVYLYQKLANCLEDASKFDNILDQYDAFTTMFNVVTDGDTPFLDDEVDEITHICVALEDSLSHRIAITQPQNELRDTAVHFRGGLNQLVAGADVPQKCAIGLLKWAAKNNIGKATTTLSRGDHVANLTRLSFDWSASVRPIQLPTADQFCLARTDMNVGHIFHPSEFITYIHEAAHLIQNTLFDVSQEQRQFESKILTEDPGRAFHRIRIMRIRIREYFAGILTFLFVFNEDADLFSKYHVSNYYTQSRPRREDDKTRIEFEEHLLIGFIVADQQIRTDENALIDPGWINDTTVRFEQFVNRYGPLFAEFPKLINGTQAWDDLLSRFIEVIPQVLSLIKPELRQATEIYCRFVEEKTGQSFSKGVQKLALLSKKVAEALDDGNPTALRVLEINDELLLVCQLLQAYVERCYRGFTAESCIHVKRDDNGLVHFPETISSWNQFMLDRGYSGLFSVEPEARQEKLKWEITIHKKLWDFSAKLRSRRFVRIIQDGGIVLNDAQPHSAQSF